MQVGLDREKARSEREKQGYQGELIKSGSGTLTLTGNNSYSGNTIVRDGRLAALNQSLANSPVQVKAGGQLEILANASVKKPTAQGFQTTVRQSTSQTVTATIEQGATFVLNNGVANLNLNFAKGSTIQAAEFDQTTMDQLQIGRAHV